MYVCVKSEGDTLARHAFESSAAMVKMTAMFTCCLQLGHTRALEPNSQAGFPSLALSPCMKTMPRYPQAPPAPTGSPGPSRPACVFAFISSCSLQQALRICAAKQEPKVTILLFCYKHVTLLCKLHLVHNLSSRCACTLPDGELCSN